jgi:hypothetical protein
MTSVEQEAKDEAEKMGLKQCPNGCGFEHMEVGKEDSSFLAMVANSPMKYLRCSKCMFGDDNKSNATASDEKAVVEWNKIVDKENAK